MPKINLYKNTVKLLNKTDIPLDQISRDLGLQLRWLYYFKNEQIEDPGVKKVEKIYDYLNNQ